MPERGRYTEEQLLAWSELLELQMQEVGLIK